jgi:hypothetical protein
MCRLSFCFFTSHQYTAFVSVSAPAINMPPAFLFPPRPRHLIPDASAALAATAPA